MYQDECDRRMRSVGGGSSSKEGNGYGRNNRGGGAGRDGDRSSSSSYRDRSGRDGGRISNSHDQYQNNDLYGGTRAGAATGGVPGVQAPPPLTGPQPLMAQQFNPPQPMMGLMGQASFQFVPPPPPSIPNRK